VLRKRSTSCIAWARRKTEAPKLSAALIFFSYFFVSRQKSNWGLGQRPIILNAEVVLSGALFFGSFFGRTKKEQENICANHKTVALKLSATLIFFVYFFVSRQKNN
jgi:hypothetical protein